MHDGDDAEITLVLVKFPRLGTATVDEDVDDEIRRNILSLVIVVF